MTAAPEITPSGFEPEPTRFRQVLGHFCTGVTVITTVDEDGPAGFACQSFAAVSLEPPLVLFCPSRTSAHLAADRARRALLRERAHRRPARPGPDLRRGHRGHRRGQVRRRVLVPVAVPGAPVLDGVLTWVGATVEAVHEAGDHYVVLGRVPNSALCRRAAAAVLPRPLRRDRSSAPRTARPRSSTPCSPGPATPTGCNPVGGVVCPAR